jgi:hypothetical protein
MSKVLFLEDKQKVRGQEYGTLPAKLGQKYGITFVSSLTDMLGELNKEQMQIGILEEPDPPEYDLLTCDTGALYKMLESEPQGRAQWFKDKVLPYFIGDLPIPVILLADKELADYIRDAVRNSRVVQFDKPFDPEKVLEEADSLISEYLTKRF